jgi:hypothetical protein
MIYSNILALLISITFSIAFVVVNFSVITEYIGQQDSYQFISILFFTITCLLLPSFFLLKKMRQSITLTVAVMIGFGLYINREKAILVITNLYKDTLPSSWSVYYDSPGIFVYLTSSFAYFLMVRLIVGRYNERPTSVLRNRG